MTKYMELKEKYKDKRIILHVASYLSPMKGTEYAIEAMGYVNKEFPDVLLLIIFADISNTDRVWELSQLAEKCGVKIQFVAMVKDEDMPSYYSLAEVLLAPSLDENVHLPQLEAQSCECPAITFGGSKLSEEVIHAQTGYTANHENAFSLSQWTIRAMKNPQFRLGKLGRQFILDNFTWDKCIESYKRILNEVSS